ncbi:MAG: response regulator transcription factor [Duodenibacillus sp.]|nr:response regulator transcription factor [Duodenibacillus sp.]
MNPQDTPLIRVVDDDPDVRESLELLLMGEGWDVQCFDGGRAFLAGDMPSRPGCVLLDVRMPEMTGLELQEILRERGYPVPIIFLTGHGDVEMAVAALKTGAENFLMKPFQADKLLVAIGKAVEADLKRRRIGGDEADWKARLAGLTDRETKVIELAMRGLLNREIGEALAISERTVHAHRRSAYKKLGVHTAAELAPLLEILG